MTCNLERGIKRGEPETPHDEPDALTRDTARRTWRHGKPRYSRREGAAEPPPTGFKKKGQRPPEDACPPGPAYRARRRTTEPEGVGCSHHVPGTTARPPASHSSGSRSQQDPTSQRRCRAGPQTRLGPHTRRWSWACSGDARSTTRGQASDADWW